MKWDGKLSIALHILAHLAAAGVRPTISEELAAHLGTNLMVVRRSLAGLREVGIVGSVKLSPRGGPGRAPCYPPGGRRVAARARRSDMGISSERGVAEINGARIAYEIAGSGHPLTLVHAGITDMRMWDDQFTAFAAEFRVLRYDIRGFGQSPMPPGPWTMRADLRALLDGLGIARTHLIGVSMGGSIAIDFTLDYPERVAALIPVAAGVGGTSPSAWLRERYAAIEERITAGDLDGANELELRLWLDGEGRAPDQVDPAVRERVREMNAAVLVAESSGEQGEPVARLDPPAIGRLGEIASPTLVIVGTRDIPDVRERANQMATAIPGARLEILEGVAHLPPMEIPERFNRLVLEFLRGQG